jgi:type III secretion system FlhB-like substrate exporter
VLAEALAGLQLDAEVPEELWAAVAEALVWAHRMDLGALRRAE